MGDASRGEEDAKTLPQYVAALTACLGGFSLGCSLGWSSPVTVILIERKGFSEFNADLVGSSLTVGAACGVLFVPLIVDSIGRKSTMLWLVPPFLGGWLLIALAGSNVTLYVIGRLVTGACGGVFCVCAPIYTAEISQPKIRGKVGVLFQLLLVLGILYAYCFGFIDSEIWISAVCAAGPFCLFLTMIFVPESPVFYLLKNREDDARMSMRFFRGEGVNFDREIDEMKESVALSKSRNVNISMLRSKPVLKVLGLGYGMMVAQQLSGINAVIFYSVIIFKAAGSSMDPLIQSVILAVIQVFACLAAVGLIDKVGRKFLMIVSEAVMGFCLFSLGAYFLIREQDTELAEGVSWLPLAAMGVYIMAFCFGAGPVPWTYLGEIFPPELKGAASSSAVFLNWLLAFAVTVSFNSLTTLMGTPGIFWTFAAICFANVAFCCYFMIETKGKTLEEILRELGVSSAMDR